MQSNHLFDEIDGRLKIQAKINKLPLDAFPLVLFLLQDEHSVVEELLQFLIGIIDAHLLEAEVQNRNYKLAT